MNKVSYILAAINDTQAIIRATDTKAAALLAALIIPISSIEKIFSYFVKLSSCQLTLFLGSLFTLFWLLAFYTVIKAISSIDNPSQHINDCDDAKGSFHLGGLFELGERDIFINSNKVKSTKNLNIVIADYPSEINDIAKELSFEHMKLVYIRDIKTHRLLASIKFSILALLVGLVAFLVVTFFQNQ